MPRPASTADVFAAIAEPRRRQLLGLLAETATPRRPHAHPDAPPEERDVTWLVEQLGWPQPQVSKHLGVLRRAGLVRVEHRGRRRLYTLSPEELRPVHDWIKSFERLWDHQLTRIKARAERLQRDADARPRPTTP